MAFSSGGGQTVGSTTDNGDGSYTATITSTQKAGSSTITATDSATHVSGSAQLTQTVPPPLNASPPTISGTAQQGQTLTESHGSWSNDPTSYAYQWGDCNSSGGSCSAISGATGQSYTLSGSDVGHTVRVLETASNAGGSAQAASLPTGVVAAPSPTALSIQTSGAVSRSGFTVDPGIRLSCPAGGATCSARVQATVLIAASGTAAARDTRAARAARAVRSMSVGSARLRIPAGGSLEAVFRLNQLGQTLLLDHKRLQLQINISGEVQAAPPHTATKTIVLDGRFADYEVSAIRSYRDGTISLRVKVTAPGQINVLVTAWKDNVASAARVLNPARGRFVVARATATAKHAGMLTLNVRPDARGRALIARPAYRVTLRLWVSYIPLYAFQTDTGYYGLHPGGSCTNCHKRVWP